MFESWHSGLATKNSESLLCVSKLFLDVKIVNVRQVCVFRVFIVTLFLKVQLTHTHPLLSITDYTSDSLLEPATSEGTSFVPPLY